MQLFVYDVLKDDERLVEQIFREVADECLSQVLFFFLHNCSALEGLDFMALGDHLLAWAFQNLVRLNGEDLLKELPVVGVVCGREEIGILAVVD